MKLTPGDYSILNSYSTILDGLANYMGAGYEFVLHSLEHYDKSIIKIINGYYSNRTIGAPVTNLALEMLKKIESQDDQHQYITYFNRKENVGLIKSSTLPILGDSNRIIGLLCINFYMDTPLSSIISSFSNMADSQGTLAETFADNIDELIVNALEEAKSRVYNNTSILSINRNKEILAILFEKGIFNLKDAVLRVATSLGISKNTVYLHIRNLEEKK